MKKKIKKIFSIRNIIIISILVLISTPYCMHYLFTNKFIFGFISDNNYSAWVQYWGSIIGGIFGGLITLGGVWLTINHQNKKSDEEHSKRYKIEHSPILKAKFHGYSNNCIYFILENIGNDVAIFIQIDRIYTNSQVELFVDQSEEGQIYNEILPFLGKGETSEPIPFKYNFNPMYLKEDNDIEVIFTYYNIGELDQFQTNLKLKARKMEDDEIWLSFDPQYKKNNFYDSIMSDLFHDIEV